MSKASKLLEKLESSTEAFKARVPKAQNGDKKKADQAFGDMRQAFAIIKKIHRNKDLEDKFSEFIVMYQKLS